MLHCGAGRMESRDLKSREGNEDGKMGKERKKRFSTAQSWKDPPTQMKENRSADGQVHQGEERWWSELGRWKGLTPSSRECARAAAGWIPKKKGSYGVTVGQNRIMH